MKIGNNMEYICYSLDQMNEACKLARPGDGLWPVCKENEFLPQTSDKPMIVQEELPIPPGSFLVTGKSVS